MSNGKRTGREVNIFNFSFLDILACTVGALIFILVMVILVNSYSASQSEIYRRIKELENKYAASKEEAAEIVQKKSQILSELKDLENAIQLGRERDNLINELTRKKIEVDKIEQHSLRFEEKKVQIKPPREFEVKDNMSPTVPLVFQNERIAPIEAPYFEIIMSANGRPIPRRLKEGETLDIALRPRSAFNSMISLYNNRTNFVPMVVYPSGFSTFLKIRNHLYNNNWDYSLFLITEDTPLKFGPGTHTILR
jgi:hypothetical protein